MKKSITALAFLAAAICAQAADDNKSQKPPSVPHAQTIPADAVKEANGTYSYTDKDGKKWVYRNTPFGVVRLVAPESGADPAAAPKQTAAAKVKVIDKGDTVQFERGTPFGPTRWEKKKSDLTDEERKMVDAQNPPKTETAPPDTK